MPTVLILGATSDIGNAIARKFASNKYNLHLGARSVQSLQAICTDLSIRYNIECTAHDFDALDFSKHHSFYEQLHPKPDITICVFGYMNDNEVVINSQEETLRTIHTNYTGAVSILNIVAQEYASQKKGTIAGISSVAGERGRQSNYIYGSAKAGFTAYLSGLRNKMYHSNVHVLTVLPGFVYTKMTEHLTLPKLLTASADQVANAVYNAVQRKKNVIYVKWFWRWIMYIIKWIPESIFKKKTL
ncbi:MAG: SDR family oxidoreductase [Chitinophagaceae bacterium]|nr:SDR family oxidoreductase [Chitinophagaceae bacterium]